MAAEPVPQAQAGTEVLAVDRGHVTRRPDTVAVERTLEIRVVGAGPVVTMRTPGHDLELTAGLLHSEGLVEHPDDILDLRHWSGDDSVRATIRAPAERVRAGLAQSSLATSACGVCGKSRLELTALEARPPPPAGPALSSATLLALPQRLRAAQGVFDATGGLHAAALFDAGGDLLAVREDVGRHNALDKLVGWALRGGRLPLHDHIVLLSGRASFELLQKAIMAGVPVVCAVSAPSSYAVDLARAHGVTLVGFLRDRRYNVYSHPQRLSDVTPDDAGGPRLTAATG